MAPPVSYLQHVLAPTLRLLGICPSLQVQLMRRGFYPKGGGVVRLGLQPLVAGASLPAWSLVDRGQVCQLTVRAYGAGRQPSGGVQRLADTTAKALQPLLRHLQQQLQQQQEGWVASGQSETPPQAVPADSQISGQLQGGAGIRAGGSCSLHVEVTKETKDSAVGEGWGLSVTATTTTGRILAANVVGERGVVPDDAAHACAAEMAALLSSGACVDQWMQDQLIIFMALAAGQSRMLCTEPTLHTRTAVAVAEQLTGARFQVTRWKQHMAQAGCVATSLGGATDACPPASAAAMSKACGSAGMLGHAGAMYSNDLWLITCNGCGHARVMD